ncbi:hypothetical protein AB0M02_27335 [Actinoplanes sp. NPDC051861]|uniref:hypothetical protein n=1 Tax=Actinoplanes sp. NPDC051861 TaxID=3155170 RepID=UPI003437A88F
MGVDAAHEGRPAEDGEEFADQRAASLRRMFPQRRPSVIASSSPVHSSPAPSPTPSPAPAPGVPGRRRRRWLPVLAGVVSVLVLAGLAASFPFPELGFGRNSAAADKAAEGFPIVEPPSFESTAPSSASSGSPSGPSSPASAPAAGPAPSRTATVAGPAPEGPITDYTACAARTTATFAATFNETFSYHHVFIDADGDATTGYRIPEVTGGLGADWMIEDDVLYRSTGPEWAWQEVDATPLLTRSGNEFRWRVRPEYAGVRVTFSGSQDDADVFTPAVRVRPC